MQAFTTVTGVAAALPAANINTDVIMPKQFLKGIDRSGLGEGAFHDLRFDSSGRPRNDFVLNQAPWRKACFLVVGPNFGTGSSREHAVWGLMQLGIRAIVGTTFAGIFFDNCANNGLLAITIANTGVARLSKFASNPASNVFTVDLQQQSIESFDKSRIAFDIEPDRKEALLRGLDAIDQTLKYRDEIEAFERRHLTENPWLA
jgi:3-isopropylmalate/(R)-2-methylmalate dehydratase small subunit